MLRTVSISNYRGFKSYKMEGLERVNLLVGKNNGGKTSILEGIQFLTSGGDPSVLDEVAKRRGELILPREGNPPGSIDIAHFFYGHALTGESAFSISGDNGYTPVVVKTVARGGDKESVEGRQDRALDSGYFLRIARQNRRENDEPRYSISRDGGVDFDVPARYRRVGGPRRAVGHPVRFVGPDSLNSFDMAVMWDEVTLTGQERDIAAAMTILEPELESVHFLAGMFAAGYYPARAGIVVAIKGQEFRMPLGSLGDGMRRLMTLSTALAFTKKGCLFADEIDTGLHYSVMPAMWKLIVERAIASDTQVFATTHSWDCIEGLSKLCQLEPELMSSMAIHKIDRAIPYSIAFSGESVVRMAKGDIDPR